MSNGKKGMKFGNSLMYRAGIKTTESLVLLSQFTKCHAMKNSRIIHNRFHEIDV